MLNVMNMAVLIQRIETYWTKSSRGQPRATVRNSVPETYMIENLPKENGVNYIQVRYSEHDDFQEPSITSWILINENQQREIGLDFKLIESNVLLVSRWKKNGFLKKVGELTQGSWLKLVSNERVVLDYTWAYKKHVFNIYFGNPSEMNAAFSSKQPVHSLNLEIDLW